jgi:hypothetical protein
MGAPKQNSSLKSSTLLEALTEKQGKTIHRSSSLDSSEIVSLRRHGERVSN